mgnify:CR=1 FL=1
MHIDYVTGLKCPGCYVLTNSKTEKCYTLIFNYLKEFIEENCKIKNIHILSYTTDFEQSMINVLHSLFPYAKHVGCWFHYKECLLRNATGLKTKNIIDYTKTIINDKLGILPFIYYKNHNIIQETINKIKYETLKEHFEYYNEIEIFLTYFQGEWPQYFINGSLDFHNISKSQRTNSF